MNHGSKKIPVVNNVSIQFTSAALLLGKGTKRDSGVASLLGKHMPLLHNYLQLEGLIRSNGGPVKCNQGFIGVLGRITILSSCRHYFVLQSGTLAAATASQMTPQQYRPTTSSEQQETS
jgi:hypothetical protein